MSRQYHSIAAFVCLLAIGFAAIDAEQRNTTRNPASLTKKELRLGELRNDNHLRHTHKIQGPLKASIAPSNKQLAEVGQTFVLKGLISSTQDLRNVDFKWAVPSGLEVISGQVAGQIVDVKADQPVEVHLTLRKLASENRQVHLVTGAARDGVRFGDSAQFNTEIQEMLDQENEVMRMKALNTGKDTGKPEAKGLKVHH